MIQKKKFSDAIAANISVVGELMSEATTTKKGLMPSKQVWMTQLGAYTEDLNDVKRECRLEINSSTINNPVGDWAVCETKYFSTMCIQIVYEYFQANSIYVRSYNNSKWAGWRKISVSYSG